METPSTAIPLVEVPDLKSKLQHTSVSGMKYVDEKRTVVECMVTFPSIQADPIPYTAHPVDNTEHGPVIYAEIMAGKWGEILPFCKETDRARKSNIAGFDRLNQMNNTDWLVTRHRDEKELGDGTSITEDQYLELLKYRSDLRNWPKTDAFPDGMPTAPTWLR